MERTYYKSRLRNKGQITIPVEVRSQLRIEEGDDLIFSTDEQGRVIVSRAQIISPEQSWFWNKRWQRLEVEAQADLDAGRVVEFNSLDEALAALDQVAVTPDAED